MVIISEINVISLMMFYTVVFSVLLGAVVTVVVELLVYYRLLLKRPPEPKPRRPRHPKVQEGAAVRESLQADPERGERGVTESCDFLNAVVFFVFRELRDSAAVRRWLVGKIRVEFEEILRSRTAGRALEALALRDVSLGARVPEFRSMRLLRLPASSVSKGDGFPEQLDLEVDLEYGGGFHLGIDAELVFGKSAYLFVKVTRVAGRIRLRFSRHPFTHWSFTFIEEPDIRFEVKSHFEGRPLPQLTSIIENQLRKAIRKKHTLPNYKMRCKPFFPPRSSPCDIDLWLKDSKLSEGMLQVTLIECSRLFIRGSREQEVVIHCTLELNEEEWKEKERSVIREVELVKGTSIAIGMTFRQFQPSDGETGHVVVETVTANSAAAAADIQKGDRLVAIGGTKVMTSTQAVKLLKQAGDRVTISLERAFGSLSQPSSLISGSSFTPGSISVDCGPTSIQPVPDEDPFQDAVFLDPLERYDGRDGDSEPEDVDSLSEGDGILHGGIHDDSSCFHAPPQDLTNPFVTPSIGSPSRNRSMTALASKPLDNISPILGRRWQSTSLQRVQAKASETPVNTLKSGKLLSSAADTIPIVTRPIPASQGGRPPPIPPRPQLRGAPLGLESMQSLVDASDGDRSGEKSSSRPAESVEADGEFLMGKIGFKEPVENREEIWETKETVYSDSRATWPAGTSQTFEVDSKQRWLTVAVWCRNPLKPGYLHCLGHTSVSLMEIAFECMATASFEHRETFSLSGPELQASASRTSLRATALSQNLSSKPLCHGDVTLHFAYWKEEEEEGIPSGSDLHMEAEDLPAGKQAAVTEQTGSIATPTIASTGSRHVFCDAQFQNLTYCDYCKKKVWTKAASQCTNCAYVCHKKCQERCLGESGHCVPGAQRHEARDASVRISHLRQSVAIARQFIPSTRSRLSLTVPKTLRAGSGRLKQTDDGATRTGSSGLAAVSDNDSSDNETIVEATSPSRKSALVAVPVSLEDSVYLAVKDIGREIFRGLPPEDRQERIKVMLEKLQQEVELELEQRVALEKEVQDIKCDGSKPSQLTHALRKSTERLQALTLLSIHYRAGLEEGDQGIEGMPQMQIDLGNNLPSNPDNELDSGEPRPGPGNEPDPGNEPRTGLDELRVGPDNEPRVGLDELRAGPDNEPRACPDSELRAGPDNEPRACPHSELRACPDGESRAGPDSEPWPGSDSEPLPGPDSEASPDIESRPGPSSELWPDPRSSLQPEQKGLDLPYQSNDRQIPETMEDESLHAVGILFTEQIGEMSSDDPQNIHSG
uniref:PDZ domain containing 8 n=1 Tax=Eptatretus burgeri TaxID=7764 RepID=A0A8C4Q231_EPTBU